MLLMPLFVGCSAVRLTYNQGPFLAYWWLDGYADFNPEQAPRVKAALEAWFAWHRSTQLADYAQALADLQALADDSLSAAQVCQQVQAWQQRAERAFEQALPAIADHVRTLSAAQLRHIERQQAKKQADAEADYLQDDADARRKASLKRSVDRAESLYGSLTAPQRQMVAAELAHSPFKPELWLAERRQRQQDILRHLQQWSAERTDTAVVQVGLRQLGLAALASPRPGYQAYADAVAQANCALSAKLHNSSSPAQRQHAVAKLKGWEDDLRALMARR